MASGSKKQRNKKNARTAVTGQQKAGAQKQEKNAKPQQSDTVKQSKAQNENACKNMQQTYFDAEPAPLQPTVEENRQDKEKTAANHVQSDEKQKETEINKESTAPETTQQVSGKADASVQETESAEESAAKKMPAQEKTSAPQTQEEPPVPDAQKETPEQEAPAQQNVSYAQETEPVAELVLPEIPAGMPKRAGKRRKKKHHYFFWSLMLVTVLVVCSSTVWIYRLFSTSQIDLFNVRQDIELPNLIGLRWNEVKNDIAYRNIVLEEEPVYHESAPYGEIVDQMPRAPRQVKEGSRLVVKVSRGAQTVTVPDLAGWNKETAKEKLRALGVTLMIQPVADETVEPDCVVRTEPAAGTIVKQNTTVTMYVCREKTEIPFVTVPQCVGATSQQEAGKRLSRNGLMMSAEYLDADLIPGTVVEQTPAAGSRVLRGSTVRVTIVR